jgi:MFS family permease
MSEIRNRRSSSSTAPMPDVSSSPTKSTSNIHNQTTKDRVEKCMSVVIACVMIDMMGISLTVPINTAYALQIQGEPSSCVEDETSQACLDAMIAIRVNIGYLMTAASVAMFVSTMWMPSFSDKFGRRKAVIVSIFGSVCGFLFSAIAWNYSFLMFAKIFGGLFGGTATVASAFVVDLYEPKERPKRFANLGSAAISAFVFGPFIGGGLSQFGLRVPLWVAVGCSTIAWVLTLIYVQDPRSLTGQDSSTKTEKVSKTDDKDVKKTLLDEDHHSIDRSQKDGELKDSDGIEMKKLEEGESKNESKVTGAGNGDKEKVKDDNDKKKEEEKKKDLGSPLRILRCWLIAIETGLTTLAFNALPSLLPLILFEERLGIVKPGMNYETKGEKVALWVMVLVPVFGCTQIICLRTIYPKLVAKFGLLEVGSVGCFIFSCALLLYPFYTHPGFIFISQFLMAFGNHMQTNVSNTYLAKYAPKDKVAKTLAMGTMSDQLGTSTGPMVMTGLYAINRFLPFFMAAAFGVIAGLICIGLRVVYGDPNADSEKKGRESEGASDMVKTLFHGGLAEQIEESESLIHESGDPQYFHPAAYRHSLKPEHLYTMNKLDKFLYEELVEKFHMSGLASRRKLVREHFLQTHQEAIAGVIDMWHDPNESEDSLQKYLNDVSLFLLEQGHEEWAKAVPGAQYENLQSMMRHTQTK